MASIVVLNNYMGLLDSLADDDKLGIIRALTDSLRKKSEKASLDGLYGAWKDDKSAEEIIEYIRDGKYGGMMQNNISET
jgi:hypothetical protein